MGRAESASARTGAVPAGAGATSGCAPVSGKVGDGSAPGPTPRPWPNSDGVAMVCWLAARPWLTIVLMPRTAPQVSTKQATTAGPADRVLDGIGRAIQRR